MDSMIDVRHLSQTFGTRKHPIKVLDNLSFSIQAGEFVGIMGPSGAGKTTLMNILSSLSRPSMGSVFVAGRDITRMSEIELSEFRRKTMGFIFQEFNLLETLTSKENILLPLAINALPTLEIEKRVREVTGYLGINPLLDRYPEELSVGQKQRVAAARAIVAKPEVIFADEPTGSLDSKSAAELLRYLTEINEFQKTTILMVTHDPYSASYCNRILFLKDGAFFAEVVRRSSRKEFFEQVIDMQATIGGGGRTNAL